MIPNNQRNYRIIRNRAMCLRCYEVLESRHRHDLMRCKCDALCIDGGSEYGRVIGDRYDCMDLSVTEPLVASLHRPVRIFAFSDWHEGVTDLRCLGRGIEGLTDRLKGLAPDTAICAGDFMTCGTVVSDFFTRVLAALADKPAEPGVGFSTACQFGMLPRFGFSPGNHESQAAIERLDGWNEAVNLSFEVHHLGADILVYGIDVYNPFDVPPRKPTTISSAILDAFVERVLAHPARKKIFVSHEPPQEYRRPGDPKMIIGNPRVSVVARRTRPDLIICGHYHTGPNDQPGEPYRMFAEFENHTAEIINPGPLGVLLEL